LDANKLYFSGPLPVFLTALFFLTAPILFMKILVTGAAGKVGSFVVRELLEYGHQVRALDKIAFAADLRERAEVVYADLTDRIAMLRAAQGMDAIAHLAAIPNPTNGQDLEIFEPNVVGTHYVFAAAEAHGIQKVAFASSCAIYGAPFASKPFEMQYLPLDEKHPIEPQDLYALSKHFGELTAATYTRRTGMATTCLRLHMVVDFASKRWRWMHHHIEHSHERASNDLWHYIDVRDAARAFRLALENVETGHHVAIAVARDILTTHDRRDLIRRHYPHLERFLDSDWDFDKYGFLDSRAAEEIFGFVAQHFWRDSPALQESQKE
jgi:nucleoside-diphosphate-sugar epimerase